MGLGSCAARQPAEILLPPNLKLGQTQESVPKSMVDFGGTETTCNCPFSGFGSSSSHSFWSFPAKMLQWAFLSKGKKKCTREDTKRSFPYPLRDKNVRAWGKGSWKMTDGGSQKDGDAVPQTFQGMYTPWRAWAKIALWPLSILQSLLF